MLFEIEITETLQKRVVVDAESLSDALQEVHKKYDEGEYILDAECLTGLEISNV